MARVYGLILAMVMAASATFAQSDDPIEGVIGSQLQAFNDRDVDAAWEFASPMIQGMFRTPENFGAMVQNGYPMVWDNADAQFLERREFPQGVMQEVLVRGPDGALWVLDYQMVETENGWQINGVSVVPAPDVGV
jgi:hypothetical protein